MRLRTLAAACLAATAALTGTTGPAFAATPDTTPTLSPFPGPVSGEQPVTATSDAAFVRFTAFDGGQTGQDKISDVVPVDKDTHQATWTWQTWGFRGGSAVIAQDCDSAAGDVCGAASEEQVADVDNTATSDLPTDPVLLDPDVADEKTLSVTVAPESAGGTLSLVWPLGGVSADVTAGAPAVLDFSGVTGPHTDKVLLQRFSTIDPQICATDATSADVTVRRGLYPRIEDLSSPVISPNGDGRLDSADATAWFDAGTQSATWQLLDASGAALATPQTIDLSHVDAQGQVGFTVDPAKAGITLADGDYTLEVDSAGTIQGHDFTGEVPAALTVDTTPATVLGSVAPSRQTLYPVRDGYQDTLPFRVLTSQQGDEGASTTVVRVRNAAGSVVRTFTAPLDQAATWDGRTGGGAVLPEGKYVLEATAIDAHGNASQATSAVVTLSQKKLTQVTWTRTLSAQSSFVGSDSGRCAVLRRPGLRGWSGGMGYYSNAKCKPARVSDGFAVGVHGVYLPSAISYSSVRVEAYGGAAKAGGRDAAAVNWLLKDNGGILSKYYTVGPKPGWHNGGSPSPRSVVWSDHSILWAVVTAEGARYDVAKFRVTVVRTVLK